MQPQCFVQSDNDADADDGDDDGDDDDDDDDGDDDDNDNDNDDDGDDVPRSHSALFSLTGSLLPCWGSFHLFALSGRLFHLT